ncbi:hypothetical protein [Natrinema salaciae]|uniref:Uncharacterized protein n=1 Tax=Natrinema salaciae TaxID=1186196 RepID=A0A1H9EYR0_9EURY|nr:hypothetical protein [Natrinema salaciae]SEQ30870.1 hypothetical protein SAMN04489841_1421 [Natrinema salaciae]
MPDTGYCTLDDVRRTLRKSQLPGDISQDEEIAVDAIVAETEPLEKSLKRHWYEPDGISETTEIDIPTEPKSRDDEEDIPTGGAHLVGDPITPKMWQGDYTRIELERRDAESISELLVRDSDGGYTDWVSSNDYDGGPWPGALGQDYVLRVNNGGWSHLYLDTTNLLVEDADEDDEYYLDSFSNAVYVSFDYGHKGIPRNVRRAVALRAGAELVEEAVISIPENATLYNIETKAEEMRTKADDLLEVYL